MEFPTNSNRDTPTPKKKAPKAADEPKDIQKVVTGEALKKPKSIGEKARNLFFASEFKTAAIYIATDVLIPSIRNLIFDSATEGVRRMVYGESTPPHRSQIGGGSTSRFSYNTPVHRSTRGPDRSSALSKDIRRRRGSVDDIILVSKVEADLVVERLYDIVDRYQCATLADLYDLVGFPSSYTDNDWGWTVLKGVNVRQVREGFLIDLPPVEPTS